MKFDNTVMFPENESSIVIEESVYIKMMKGLEHSPELNKDGFSLLLYKHNIDPRYSPKQILNEPDVELLWAGWRGPKILWFLKFLLKNHSGLLKINNFKKVNNIIGKSLGMEGIVLLFVPEEKEREIIKWSKYSNLLFDLRSIFRGTEEYFYMDISCDYDDSGDELKFIYLRVLNYGEQLSIELKDILTATK